MSWGSGGSSSFRLRRLRAVLSYYFTENTEEGWLPGLGLVQALVGDVEDLVKQEVDIRIAGTFTLGILGSMSVRLGRAYILLSSSESRIVASLALHGAVHRWVQYSSQLQLTQLPGALAAQLTTISSLL